MTKTWVALSMKHTWVALSMKREKYPRSLNISIFVQNDQKYNSGQGPLQADIEKVIPNTDICIYIYIYIYS